MTKRIILTVPVELEDLWETEAIERWMLDKAEAITLQTDIMYKVKPMRYDESLKCFTLIMEEER